MKLRENFNLKEGSAYSLMNEYVLPEVKVHSQWNGYLQH